jgi:NADPH:quinone reductase-like Zn-dependent oxidoreductase
MRAITYSEFGSADVLSLTDIPEPHIGPDVLVIGVKAAGINPVDYKVRLGYLKPIMDAVFPIVPGWDVAGVVLKAGIDTPEFSVGDEVYAYARKDILGGGTLAEQVAVPVRMLAHKPRSISFEQAAGVPLTGLTALQSVRRAGVGPGDRVLIHGGAGGVGSFGIQLAALAGATVVATASAPNHDYLASLGATPIEYGDGLVERALGASAGGYDVILDFAGGASLDGTRQLLREGGRVVSIADARVVEFGGVNLWVRPDAAGLAELAELIDAGKVSVEVSQVFDLADTADAYRALEGGHVRGKVVVRI